MQKPLAFIMRSHRLAVAAEALSPPVQDAVPVWDRVEGGGGSATALQTTGHGVSWAFQQEHRAGLPHLTHRAQDRESQQQVLLTAETLRLPFTLHYMSLLTVRVSVSVCHSIFLPFVAFSAEQIIVILNTSFLSPFSTLALFVWLLSPHCQFCMLNTFQKIKWVVFVLSAFSLFTLISVSVHTILTCVYWLFHLLFMFHMFPVCPVSPVLGPWPHTPLPVSGLWGSRWSRGLSPAAPTTPPPHTAAPAVCPADQTCSTSIQYHTTTTYTSCMNQLRRPKKSRDTCVYV